MLYNLLGKQIRGRFGFPSGEIATNSDTARYLLNLIPQLGIYVGKSTTIDPKLGNREDIFIQPTKDSGWNAVGFTNPGLEATIEGFCELKETVSNDVFLMPQIGESSPDKFAHCISEFEKKDCADGYEANVSCGHAKEGGINLSDLKTVYAIFSEMRKATKKPLVAKLNASSPELVKIVRAAVEGGADAVSLINTIPGPHPEIKNKFGGYSGPPIFPVLYDIAKLIKNNFDITMLFMGGIRGASDIRKLEEIEKNCFCEIGTAFAEMDSDGIRDFFGQLELDLKNGTDLARQMTENKKALQYQPFIIKDIVELSENLRLFRFYENLNASPGQFVSLKVGDSRTDNKIDDEYSKPFSVANDKDNLELVIRKVGDATSKIFTLGKNTVVRIKGPYGKNFNLPENKTVVYVGAGCGIAPIHHAATHHKGNKLFVLGATTKKELAYIDQLHKMGNVVVSTDDGSLGYKGFVPDLLEKHLKETNPKDVYFFNCGPEIAMRKVDEIERRYASPDKIYHLVERMTSCGVGICGKSSIPNGKRACVDGPVFEAAEFTPGQYKRDETGKKVKL